MEVGLLKKIGFLPMRKKLVLLSYVPWAECESSSCFIGNEIILNKNNVFKKLKYDSHARSESNLDNRCV